jgi:alpha-L-arabinofuranosidase
LGVFGKKGVFLATLWPDASRCDYQMSGINLYTNYDGNGSAFGSTGVSAETSDIGKAFAYAAIHGDDASTLTLTVSNKNLTEAKHVEIKIDSPVSYSSAAVYMIKDGSHEIVRKEPAAVRDNIIVYALPPLSVALFEVTQTPVAN